LLENDIDIEKQNEPDQGMHGYIGVEA